MRRSLLAAALCLGMVLAHNLLATDKGSAQARLSGRVAENKKESDDSNKWQGFAVAHNLSMQANPQTMILRWSR